MWSTLTSLISYKLPLLNIKNEKYTGIVYFCLDFGLVWSSIGEKVPDINTYVWCVKNKNDMINYINKLWDINLVPIFYGEKIKLDVVDEILSNFTIQPPTFVGISIETLHNLISKSWTFNQIDNINVDQTTIPNCNIILSDILSIYRFGPHSLIGVEAKIENIGFDPLYNFNYEKIILILVGQQGSGKSTIAKKLEEKGWYIINEKDAASIRRASESSKSKIMDQFRTLLSNINNFKGIVIDSTNGKSSHRKIYINEAKKLNVGYIVGWITRPGWYFNNQRDIKIPPQALSLYTKNFEIPKEDENVIRLV